MNWIPFSFPKTFFLYEKHLWLFLRSTYNHRECNSWKNLHYYYFFPFSWFSLPVLRRKAVKGVVTNVYLIAENLSRLQLANGYNEGKKKRIFTGQIYYELTWRRIQNPFSCNWQITFWKKPGREPVDCRIVLKSSWLGRSARWMSVVLSIYSKLHSWIHLRFSLPIDEEPSN